jgi:DNA-binding transcriptional regulator of glucitol operon
MRNDTGLVIGLILAAMVLQYVLAWRQARKFAQDVQKLRVLTGPGARVSVGIGRRRGKRIFIALSSVDGEHVSKSLLLSGITVLAAAESFQRLENKPLLELLDPDRITGLSPAAANATAQAAQFLLDQVSRASGTPSMAD